MAEVAIVFTSLLERESLTRSRELLVSCSVQVVPAAEQVIESIE